MSEHMQWQSSEPVLTKRELFAVMAMQGLLASGRPVSDETLSDATAAADALIEALNNTKEQP